MATFSIESEIKRIVDNKYNKTIIYTPFTEDILNSVDEFKRSYAYNTRSLCKTLFKKFLETCNEVYMTKH